MEKTVDVCSEKMFFNVNRICSPRFIEPHNLTEDQLKNPDYRLHFLQFYFGGMNTISCSKCHHCR